MKNLFLPLKVAVIRRFYNVKLLKSHSEVSNRKKLSAEISI